jgi:hypothetical protein
MLSDFNFKNQTTMAGRLLAFILSKWHLQHTKQVVCLTVYAQFVPLGCDITLDTTTQAVLGGLR